MFRLSGPALPACDMAQAGARLRRSPCQKMNKKRPERNIPPDQTVAPFSNRWQRGWRKMAAFDLRDRWWRLLDLLEARRSLRRWLYGLGALTVGLAALWHWGSPWWYRRTAL